MEKAKRKIPFELFSEDKKVITIIELMKSDNKKYTKLLHALELLGNFDGKTKVEIYDEYKKDDISKIRLCSFDVDENLFIFYGKSTDKNDSLKINKITNDLETEYDISLAKKFVIDKENVELTKLNKIYNFKFGRLITDEKSYYNLFLGNNVQYQIEGDFNINISQNILGELNKFEEVPKLMEYVNIFEKILNQRKIQITSMTISAFKDFKKIGTLSVGNKSVKENKIRERIDTNKKD